MPRCAYVHGLRVASLALLAMAASGCSIQREHESTEVKDLSDTYGWFYYGSDVENGLPIADQRPQPFGGCGHERGRVRIFDTTPNDEAIPVTWYDDRVWRSYARPAGPEGCQSDETRDSAAGTCWRTYGIQFYPSSPIAAGNRLPVVHASPILRVLPKASYPNRAEWCRFDVDTALIWVGGVNNRGLGLTWGLTDNSLLASILAWNRNSMLPAAASSDPAGHGKLKESPGYIQIVQNDNAPSGGITGDHSEVAIKTMTANLELAFRAGLSHVEVVTHSNGVVTAQLGFALFTQMLDPGRWNADDWVGSTFSPEAVAEARTKREALLAARRAVRRGTEPMQVNFYHLQAAPSQRWDHQALDRFGFFSDLLPTARWVQKTVLGVSYWGWDWLTPNYFAGAAAFVKPEFRFYYNGADWMTYDYYWYSSVGRRESLPWQSEVRDHMQARLAPKVVHYHCADADVGTCGPGHEQAESLWYFTSPAMPTTRRPVAWEVN